jgi:signal transduction histidine kinase
VTVLSEGIGLIVDSFSQAFTLRVPQLRAYGAAMYAPLKSAGRGVGVLMLMRKAGDQGFDNEDLAMAEAFAQQAAVVLVLGEARLSDDVKSLFDERERIARDLHDLAIQQLFATGMQLESARRDVVEGVPPNQLEQILAVSLEGVDDSVKQIRSISHDLRDPDAGAGMVERLRREASLARAGLGFAPSLVLALDGRVLDGADITLDERFNAAVGAALADDVVAVAREGLANAARHAKASSVQVAISVGATPDPVADGGLGHGGATNGFGTADGPIDTGTLRRRYVTVQVNDDGIGLAKTGGHRSGLNNLAARARRHGGSLSVSSPEADSGTVIVWTAPLAGAASGPPTPVP